MNEEKKRKREEIEEILSQLSWLKRFIVTHKYWGEVFLFIWFCLGFLIFLFCAIGTFFKLIIKRKVPTKRDVLKFTINYLRDEDG